jgi:hypothetical protein
LRPPPPSVPTALLRNIGRNLIVSVPLLRWKELKKTNGTTRGSQTVRFLRTLGTVLLQNRINRGVVLKSQFPNFKVPFFCSVFRKNHTKPGNIILNQGIRTVIVGFVNRTKPGTVLIETVLSGVSLNQKSSNFPGKKLMN